MTTPEEAEEPLIPCALCWEKLVDTDSSTTRFGCNHKFHSHCVWDWLLHEGAAEGLCPVCKGVAVDITAMQRRPLTRAERLLSRVIELGRMLLEWTLTMQYVISISVMGLLSTAWHTSWLFLSATCTGLLAFLVLWFWTCWLVKWPLLDMAPLCIQAQALFPAVEVHLRVVVRLLSERATCPSNSATSSVLLMLLGLGLQTSLEAARMVMSSPILCPIPKNTSL